MISAIFQTIFIQLVLPFVFIVMLWKEKANSKLEWIIKLFATIMVVSWVYLTGRWDWVSYYIRYLFIFLLIVSIFLGWKHAKTLPLRTSLNRKQKLNTGIHIVILAIFGFYNISALTGYTTPQQAMELSFPLKDGTYYVAHGGSDTQVNYHNAYEPQQFALDIVKLNSIGTRAAGFYPKELEKYAVYGEVLYSPCKGEVIEARNHLPDLPPSKMDPEHPEGNYVAINCDGEDTTLYIAHLQQNSVQIAAGDTIYDSEPIGLIGNSGNTSEPHLHIHAEKDGVGIPLRFDGEFLIRNDLKKQ